MADSCDGAREHPTDEAVNEAMDKMGGPPEEIQHAVERRSPEQGSMEKCKRDERVVFSMSVE